ncbi:MAG: PAS domain S-box protein [Candidatus Lokiarchaeota archaeon]|nr:PAS domain S-box protein [Candidatus Lokiarchaeota archaeon]MBD3341932.1 PAS domain S-box protein [Candidatus Lokiarchaeota archaeon]
MVMEEAEKSFESITNQSIMGIFIIQNRKFQYVNKKLSEITGYDVNEILSWRSVNLHKFVHEEFLKPIQSEFEKIFSNQDNITNFQFKGVKNNKEIYWAELYCKPIKHRKKLAYLGILLDITEKKQAEDKLKESRAMLQLVMDNIPQFIYWKDTNLTYLGCNKNFARVAGVGDPENIKGKTDFDLPWATSQAESFNEIDSLVMEMDKAEYHVIESQRQADGKKAWLETNRIPLHDLDGKVVGILGTYEDITERKKADELIKSQLKEKEILLKEIHHRVKNNLQIISSLLHLQASLTDHKPTISLLKDSQNRISTMALIHEYLYKSEDLSQIDFKSYVENLIQFLYRSYAISRDRISLETKIDDITFDLNIAIPCGLLITELITNSLQHAFPDDKKGIIRISLHISDDKYELIVADNGIGLSESINIENPKTLGLTLIDALTKQIKGNINVDRANGTGFKIEF